MRTAPSADDGSRRRILFVSSTLAGGGAERFVSTVLTHLDRARFEPELCLLREEIVYPLAQDVRWESLGKERAWQLPQAILRLARMLDRRRPHAVVSGFSSPSFVTGNALALARTRPRWLARVSSPPVLTDAGWVGPWMARLYRRADAVVANSEALCALFAAHYPAAPSATHLPNAIDFEALDLQARAPAPPEAPAGRLRVVSLGRLERVKRFDRLLHALARLDARFDVEVTIAGEGPEREPLERQAREAGISLRLPGFLENPYPLLASADVFALTSDREGMPNALVEAQALGRAVVATDCPTGPAEVIEPRRTGLLVPMQVEPLSDALAELLADPGERARLGAAARDSVRARFAAPEVTRRLEALLDGLAPR